MTTSIALTKATRDTVTTLRKAADQADETSLRLSTGKAVNSAFDNPNDYFMSKSLSDDAAQLDRIVEQLGQGIQVIKAADDGIEAISKLVTQATAVASQAGDSLDAFDRADYAKSYNDLLDQIAGVAKDSNYRGKNLLLGSGHELKFYFSDDAREAVTVESSDFTDTEQTLGLPKLDEGQLGKLEVSLTDGTSPLTATSKLLSDGSNFATGDVISVSDPDGNTIASLTVGDDTTVSDLISTFSQGNSGMRASINSSGVLTVETATTLNITGGTSGGAFDSATITATPSSWFDADSVTDTSEQLKTARDTVRLHSAAIGTNLTMLQNRSDFMKSFSGSLLSGSESIVAADPNEEGARLLALQTRQQLATSSMSFSTAADEGILRLLGG